MLDTMSNWDTTDSFVALWIQYVEDVISNYSSQDLELVEASLLALAAISSALSNTKSNLKTVTVHCIHSLLPKLVTLVETVPNPFVRSITAFLFKVYSNFPSAPASVLKSMLDTLIFILENEVFYIDIFHSLYADSS
jgi:hypothetical protein